MRVFVPIVLAASLASLSVTAQEATAPALTQERQGDIGFVSGGIGQSERAAMQSIAGDYNLRLMFAVRPSGEFLAGVAVTLADANGRTVLDTIANGPLFYAQVPPGRYRVTVTSDGRSEARPIDIGRSSVASQSFYWSKTG